MTRGDIRIRDGLYSIVYSDSSAMVLTYPSPGQPADTFEFKGEYNRIVCMSSGYVAALSALGKEEAIVGISGADYVSDDRVRALVEEGRIADVGYDSEPDYEKILSLSPDVVVTYSHQAAGAKFVSRLREFGVPVLVLYDYLENDPLARARYIKLFGILTGTSEKADSLYAEVEANYVSLRGAVQKHLGDGEYIDAHKQVDVRKHIDVHDRADVLVNIPYADIWFVPGGDNYMSQLVWDAGGRILGAEEGMSGSTQISVEKAFEYSSIADAWINTGWCDTIASLRAFHPLFSSFDVDRVYNNTLRKNPRGGNDFWESGFVRPDLILHDLVSILHPDIPINNADVLYYYKPVL